MQTIPETITIEFHIKLTLDLIIVSTTLIMLLSVYIVSIYNK
jgi:hypothetical protein